MEQKKLHIRPNFFDLLLVVLVLAAAVTAYLLSHDDSAGTVRQRSYTVELVGVLEGMAVSVEPGDVVTDNVKNLELGVITNVEIRPKVVGQVDEEARVMRQVPVEDYITLYLTIETDTTEDDYGINTLSGYPLRVGTEIYCSTGSLNAGGYILSVER